MDEVKPRAQCGWREVYCVQREGESGGDHFRLDEQCDLRDGGSVGWVERSGRSDSMWWGEVGRDEMRQSGVRWDGEE